MGRVEDYLGARMRGREIPEDLRRLVELELDGQLRGRDAVQPFAEVRVLAPGELHSLEEPQPDEDPAVIANGRAIAEVLGHMAVVVDGFNGDLFGYWWHPEESPAETPVVVKLDTEGEFSTPDGATLVEAMVFDWLGYDEDDEYFARIVDFCERHAIPLEARSREALRRPESTVDPVLLHDRLYRRYQPYTARPAWADGAAMDLGAAPVGLGLADEPLRTWLAQLGFPDPQPAIEALDEGMGEVRLESPGVDLTFYLDRDQGWWLFLARFRHPAQMVLPYGLSLDEDRQSMRERLGAPVHSALLIPIDRWQFGEVSVLVSFDRESGRPKRVECFPAAVVRRS